MKILPVVVELFHADGQTDAVLQMRFKADGGSPPQKEFCHCKPH